MYFSLYFIVGILFIIADRKAISALSGFRAIFATFYTLIIWPYYILVLISFILCLTVFTVIDGNLQKLLDRPFKR
jgi:hypothetical protein